MNVIVDIVNASSDTAVPSRQDFRIWTLGVMTSLPTGRSACELSIRIIDEDESAQLNETYRNRQGATNILSFPYRESDHEHATGLLGDLAICAPVVRRESSEQHKDLKAHWAHMTVHGILHLNGFDHEDSGSADTMETLEISILQQLGFTDPYN